MYKLVVMKALPVQYNRAFSLFFPVKEILAGLMSLLNNRTKTTLNYLMYFHNNYDILKITCNSNEVCKLIMQIILQLCNNKPVLKK